MGDWIRLGAQRGADRPAVLRDDGSTVTFGELESRANRLARTLRAQGVDRGDRVAILAMDGSGYLETVFACLKLGAVYVPLNYRLRAGELRTLLDRAGAGVLMVDRRYAPIVAEIRAELPALRLVACFDGPCDGADVAHEDLVAAGADVDPGVPVRDDEIVALAFTSGTTGLPKGVLQSQGMLKAMVAGRHQQYDLQDHDVRYGSSPMFHIAGQMMLYGHVMRGIPSVVLPKFDADTVLRWLGGGRVTAAFLVPTMISALLDHPRIAEADFTALRTILYGSAPMSPALLRRASDRFACDFVNAFGAGTEAGLQTVLTVTDHRRALAGDEHLLGSIGRAAVGVELRVVDDDGRDVADGEVGQIVTRSDTLMSGYLDMPEETAAAFRDGWFWGGDLARRDAEGYLYLGGRAKDMIIRGGENVYPVEIESVLAAHPAVANCAVVGRPDDHWGEIVVAFVERRPGTTVGADELRAHCRSALASYKVPVEFRFEDMPRNASGKILKRSLRERLGEVRV
ncbi:AMP-binding protein [Pseudonocardia sp. RS11V-5]|uniref:class I adenylate-forming enzyme family protein n=1 Tax=Pseudonocardia terrae TaxID=2905831 RepID=UPI001E37A715|nr:AMP-binding protein [Pseudonocardia terrae]MCE3554642.1 AMP-binding protein [Pseudonocardia terrae]